MGWSSKNFYYPCTSVNQDHLKSELDYLLKLGMDKAGFTYFMIDDCWQN